MSELQHQAALDFLSEQHRNAVLRAEKAETELSEYKATFDLRYKADMRAIKMWQKAHPGNDLVWPDQADLCIWLMEELNKIKNVLVSHHEVDNALAIYKSFINGEATCPICLSLQENI